MSQSMTRDFCRVITFQILPVRIQINFICLVCLPCMSSFVKENDLHEFINICLKFVKNQMVFKYDQKKNKKMRLC